MTDEVKVLSDDALREIETAITSGDSQSAYMAASIDNVRALCATVRALRQDVKKFSELADKRHDELWAARRQRDSLAANMETYLRDATAALCARLAQETERADGNFASYERVKAWYSEAVNKSARGMAK